MAKTHKRKRSNNKRSSRINKRKRSNIKRQAGGFRYGNLHSGDILVSEPKSRSRSRTRSRTRTRTRSKSKKPLKILF